MQGDKTEELRNSLRNRFKGVEVVEGDVDVFAAEICLEFGGNHAKARNRWPGRTDRTNSAVYVHTLVSLQSITLTAVLWSFPQLPVPI